jgi:adenylate kinase
MRVVIDEAKESYEPEIVIELFNDTIEQMDQNVARVEAWSHQWMKDRE